MLYFKTLPQPAEDTTVLCLNLYQPDRDLLKEYFEDSFFKLCFFDSLSDVSDLLNVPDPIPVILTAAYVPPDAKWQDVVKAAGERSFVIVCSRQACFEMLGDVLEGGAHDLVYCDQVDPKEVHRAVVMAWEHWLHNQPSHG